MSGYRIHPQRVVFDDCPELPGEWDVIVEHPYRGFYFCTQEETAQVRLIPFWRIQDARVVREEYREDLTQ